MDFLKLTIMFCILWDQIGTENVCPNNFSYVFGDKCYSMHVDLEYKYADAVGFCQKHGGILWSRTNDEELEFLKKVHAKIRRVYWIGIRQVGLNWIYLSDNSIASESLITKIQSEDTKCQRIDSKGNTGSIDCMHELYTVCEYTGETCKAKQPEGKDCYEFTDTPKNFTEAAKGCKLLGGRMAEYRDHNQLLQLRDALWKYNEVFDDIPVEKVKVSMGSWLPTIWNFKLELQYELQNEKLCETYLMKTIEDKSCSLSYNFACKFDAISTVNFTNAYPNSSKPRMELDTQEAGTSDSKKCVPNNTTQGIWTQDHNYTVNVIYLTVAIVGAIIIMALIITVIIQKKIIRRKTQMGNSPTCSSNSNELAYTAQNINMQRRSLPERPSNYSSHYEEVDINVEMRSFPARHREVSLQHHYLEVIET